MALTEGEQTSNSEFEQLPAELQLHIFSELDYQSAIMLSQTSQYFHAVVHPQGYSVAIKTASVKEAQYWKKHCIMRSKSRKRYNGVETFTEHYACFTCFRVKPMEAFTAQQILRRNRFGQLTKVMRNDLRCCVDCQIKKRALRLRGERNGVDAPCDGEQVHLLKSVTSGQKMDQGGRRVRRLGPEEVEEDTVGLFGAAGIDDEG
ncbi:hypothetical protein LTR08_000890 [Meristemomyces frigidus]|nr:hypothetical protein LTR08_000890 [Meristemomyces frigidus]